jgi:hypothetical protein
MNDQNDASAFVSCSKSKNNKTAIMHHQNNLKSSSFIIIDHHIHFSAAKAQPQCASENVNKNNRCRRSSVILLYHIIP